MRGIATSAMAARYWAMDTITGKEMALLCAGIDPEKYLENPNFYRVFDTDFYSREDHFYQLERLLTGEPRHCEMWLSFLNDVDIHRGVAEFFERKISGKNSQQIVNTEQSHSFGRREQQHEIILAVIAALEYDPLQIPDGGKARIKKACLTRPRAFTDAGFNHAWVEGINAGLFRLANHEKFSPG